MTKVMDDRRVFVAERLGQPVSALRYFTDDEINELVVHSQTSSVRLSPALDSKVFKLLGGDDTVKTLMNCLEGRTRSMAVGGDQLAMARAKELLRAR